jgi:hypothetical protein
MTYFILAACIGIACRLFGKRFTDPDAAFCIFLTIVLGVICFVIYMEILSRRQQIRVGKYVTNTSEVTFSCYSKRLSVPFVSLVIFIFILLVLVLTLCFLIWMKQPV